MIESEEIPLILVTREDRHRAGFMGQLDEDCFDAWGGVARPGDKLDIGAVIVFNVATDQLASVEAGSVLDLWSPIRRPPAAMRSARKEEFPCAVGPSLCEFDVR